MIYRFCLLLFQVIVIHGWASPPAGQVNVRDFGATGLKADDATTAFRKAIDAIGEQGGGTLYVPPGAYTCGTIDLCDNLVLHLDAGAVIYATNDSSGYQLDESRGLLYPVLLFAHEKRNIRITGKGTVRGEPRYGVRQVVPYDFIEREYALAKAAGVELVMPDRQPPNITLISFTSCEDITIDNISVVNSPFWSVHLHWCKRVFVNRVTILSDLKQGVNADGLDIDGCSDVIISDCYISTGDDAIVLKSTNREGGFRACESVTVNNCIVESSSSALKIGTESYGDFRKIRFTNCVIKNSNRALGIFVRDGGHVDDVVFANLTVDCNRKDFHWWGDGDLIRILLVKRNEQSRLGAISNVLISDITADVEGTSVIASEEDGFLENIVLRKVAMRFHPEQTPDLRATHAFSIQKVRGFAAEDVDVTWDTEDPLPTWRSSFALKQVEGVRLSRVRLSGNPSAPGFVLEDVAGGTFADLSSNDQQTVMGISGSRTKNLVFKGIPRKRVVFEREPGSRIHFIK